MYYGKLIFQRVAEYVQICLNFEENIPDPAGGVLCDFIVRKLES